MFDDIRRRLNLSTLNDDYIVYTNINPLLKIFLNGDIKTFKKLTSDNLPLCSDGFFVDTDICVKDRPYEVYSAKLPSPSKSISILGKDSPTLRVSDYKSLSSLCLGYCHDNWGQTSKEVFDQISDQEFDYSNIFVWLDHVISYDVVLDSIIATSGLRDLIDNPNYYSEIDVLYFSEKAKKDKLKSDRITLLNSLASDPYYSRDIFTYLLLIHDDDHASNVKIENLTKRLNILSTVISFLLEKDKTDLMLFWVQLFNDMNLVKPEQFIANKSFSTLFTYDLIKDRIKPKKALEISRFLEMPELIKKAHRRDRATKFSEDLGI